jgi:hypothetical protein
MIVKRSSVIKIFLLAMAISTITFLRPILFIALPLFLISYIFLFKVKYDKVIIYTIGLIVPVTLISAVYTCEWNLSNNALSIYFILPVLLIYFSKPKIADNNHPSYFNYFIKYITIILVFNDCIGFFQYVLHSEDDSFIGFYGLHGLGLHTLSLVNFIIAVYYFFAYKNEKQKKMNLLLFLFFILSAIFCFYGLGLIVFILTICIYNLSVKNFIKTTLISFLAILLIGFSFYLFRPQTFIYNYNNIKSAALFFNKKNDPKLVGQIPRKIILYKNYVHGYTNDIGLFFMGSGPGTFNSRTYFLLNGDYSRTKFLENTFGVHEPKYASEYVHPLWNSKNTSKKDFTDGTRNEPFSSVIAMLAEYGFIVSIFIFGLAYLNYRSLIQKIKSKLSSEQDQLFPYHHYLRFISLFMVLNLFTDNFLEYPEISLFYLLIYKLIELKTADI